MRLTIIFTFLLLLSGISFGKWIDDKDLPPLSLNELSPQLAMIDYMDRQTLAPPVAVIRRIEVEDSEENYKIYEISEFKDGSMIHEVKGDKESPEPLIIKIKKSIYLIWSKGEILIRRVEAGGENLFESIFGIKKPPALPPGNGNGHGNEFESFPPFRVGDYVTVKNVPLLRGEIGEVKQVDWVKNKEYWFVIAKFTQGNEVILHGAHAKDFELLSNEK